MVIPYLPLVNRILPAKGEYRARGLQVQRKLFGDVWYAGGYCRTEKEAQRIVNDLNAVYCPKA